MITEQEFKTAANLLNVDVASVKAVKNVESNGNGFLPSGKMKILFEGHIFWKELKKLNKNPENILANNLNYSNILYPKWTKKYYKGGEAEWNRFNEAAQIDETAAKLSTSYGLFQIMGFNYINCGFSNVNDFFNFMSENEGNQLYAFCSFIKNDKKMHNALKNKDWATFAKLYNGPAYKENKYDTKLENEYKKLV